ncbi:hypothetical protein WN51_14003 [Melipona quadrifasciata]|uniref:Uncharacterized protein n=1 Tax=Melipona quadrifasciata TaxID=166423 RepID=A0A0M8ZYW6_9HYME|nr:hypothetical protein WN51_14003 [Melipona quadrifasciata]
METNASLQHRSNEHALQYQQQSHAISTYHESACVSKGVLLLGVSCPLNKRKKRSPIAAESFCTTQNITICRESELQFNWVTGVRVRIILNKNENTIPDNKLEYKVLRPVSRLADFPTGYRERNSSSVHATLITEQSHIPIDTSRGLKRKTLVARETGTRDLINEIYRNRTVRSFGLRVANIRYCYVDEALNPASAIPLMDIRLTGIAVTRTWMRSIRRRNRDKDTGLREWHLDAGTWEKRQRDRKDQGVVVILCERRLQPMHNSLLDKPLGDHKNEEWGALSLIEINSATSQINIIARKNKGNRKEKNALKENNYESLKEQQLYSQHDKTGMICITSNFKAFRGLQSLDALKENSVPTELFVIDSRRHANCYRTQTTKKAQRYRSPCVMVTKSKSGPTKALQKSRVYTFDTTVRLEGFKVLGRTMDLGRLFYTLVNTTTVWCCWFERHFTGEILESTALTRSTEQSMETRAASARRERILNSQGLSYAQILRGTLNTWHDSDECPFIRLRLTPRSLSTLAVVQRPCPDTEVLKSYDRTVHAQGPRPSVTFALGIKSTSPPGFETGSPIGKITDPRETRALEMSRVENAILLIRRGGREREQCTCKLLELPPITYIYGNFMQAGMIQKFLRRTNICIALSKWIKAQPLKGSLQKRKRFRLSFNRGEWLTP